jgi:hypothetical protein
MTEEKRQAIKGLNRILDSLENLQSAFFTAGLKDLVWKAEFYLDRGIDLAGILNKNDQLSTDEAITIGAFYSLLDKFFITDRSDSL